MAGVLHRVRKLGCMIKYINSRNQKYQLLMVNNILNVLNEPENITKLYKEENL